MRHSLVTPGLLILFGWLQYHLWFGPGSYQELRHLQGLRAAQQAENATLTARNEHLGAEVADLKNGLEAVEERARQELGMIREGEIFYQMIGQQSAALP